MVGRFTYREDNLMSENNGASTPQVFGTLEAGEKSMLEALRRGSVDTQAEIGRLERTKATAMLNPQVKDVQIGQLTVRIARLLGSVSEIETRSQGVLETVRKRLNIDEGQGFQIQEDQVIAFHQPEGASPPA